MKIKKIITLCIIVLIILTSCTSTATYYNNVTSIDVDGFPIKSESRDIVVYTDWNKTGFYTSLTIAGIYLLFLGI